MTKRNDDASATHTSYETALACVRDLIGPPHEAHPEYRRAATEVLATLYGVEDVDTPVRAAEIAAELGVDIAQTDRKDTRP